MAAQEMTAPSPRQPEAVVTSRSTQSNVVIWSRPTKRRQRLLPPSTQPPMSEWRPQIKSVLRALPCRWCCAFVVSVQKRVSLCVCCRYASGHRVPPAELQQFLKDRRRQEELELEAAAELNARGAGASGYYAVRCVTACGCVRLAFVLFDCLVTVCTMHLALHHL